MVNFIQKNAAKIVIIAGAALISSIGGGCKCDPQKSTKSQKCVDATEKQKDECQKHSQKPTTNKNLLCEGETCDAAKDFKKDGICCETPVIEGNCADVFSAQDAEGKTTCKNNKVPSSEYKCVGACSNTKDAEKCCVAPKATPTPDCTKSKSDAADCKVAKCSENNPFRVFLGDELCKPLCENKNGTERTTQECACAHSNKETGQNVATCLKGQTCKALTAGSAGVCSFPVCAESTTGGFVSNCMTTASDGKHCKGGFFNGTKCIYEKCTDGKVATGECACTALDTDEKKNKKFEDKAKKEKKTKFLQSRTEMQPEQCSVR